MTTSIRTTPGAPPATDRLSEGISWLVRWTV